MRQLWQYGSLFLALFAVTLTLVTLETGSVLVALKVGALATPLKWLVSHTHAWWFHHRKPVGTVEHDWCI